MFCFCQDEARVHKVTKRIHTLEEVNINVKLLTEMLSHYNKDSSTDSDKEIIKVCVRAHTHTHPFLYNLKLPLVAFDFSLVSNSDTFLKSTILAHTEL